MDITREKNIDLMRGLLDSVYPNITIKSRRVGHGQTRLYSLVSKSGYFIYCVQEYSNLVRTDVAIDRFEKMCDLVRAEYIISETDIKKEEVYGNTGL